MFKRIDFTEAGKTPWFPLTGGEQVPKDFTLTVSRDGSGALEFEAAFEICLDTEFPGGAPSPLIVATNSITGDGEMLTTRYGLGTVIPAMFGRINMKSLTISTGSTKAIVCVCGA